MDSKQIVFTNNDKMALKLYCRACDEILACRFIRDLPKQDHRIWSRKRPDGSWEGGHPEYDRDDLRSFMAVFRKLLLAKEPTNIYRILRILGRHEPEHEQAKLSRIKKGLQGMEKHTFVFNLGTEDEPVPYSPREAWEVIINADMLHSDTDKQEALEKLRGFGPIFEVFLVKFVTDFSRQAVQVSEVIKSRGYID